MKRCKTFLVVALCLTCFIGNVKAEAFYVNTKGVEMSESQYNKMLQIFSEGKVSILTQAEFDAYKDNEIVSVGTKYAKETFINGEYQGTEEITKAEYDAAEEVNSCTPYASEYIETSYKRLSSSVSRIGATQNYSLVGALTWKKVPKYRSYDVFAFRLMHFNYSGFTGGQVYFKGNSAYEIPYYTTSAGYKGLSNGLGVSMNLKDDSDITSYELTIGTSLSFSSYNYASAAAYVAYEHAQANLSRANSMDYTLDISGLGNVILFNNDTISGYYDGMDGLRLEVPIA